MELESAEIMGGLLDADPKQAIAAMEAMCMRRAQSMRWAMAGWGLMHRNQCPALTQIGKLHAFSKRCPAHFMHTRAGTK